MPARLSCQPEEPQPAMEAEPVNPKMHKKSKKDKEKRKHLEENIISEKKSKHKENGVLDEQQQSSDESDLKPPKAKKHKSAKDDKDGKAERKRKREEKNGLVIELKSEAVPSSSDDSRQCSEGEIEEELTPEQREGAFSNFRISPETIKLLKGRGVTHLFPIQSQTFNHIYDGSDCVAQARTGTGKTFSFAIPLVEKLQLEMTDQKRGRPPKVLILTPTRELAIQVARDIKDITRKLSVPCFYGGTAYNGQMDSIRNGIDILVGTPGRIRDHLQNMKIDLSKLKHVVLDEVDQMLDMGFAEQVEDILGTAYKKDSKDNPQTLLFSATCPSWVYDVAKKYMNSSYKQVDLIGKRTQRAATTVEHLAITCHWSQRPSVIGDVIQVYSGSHGRTIVFCETKKEVNELAINNCIKQEAQCLHGDIPQKQREITLKGFRDGSFEVLVATNVAARGLDIPEVDLVIQNCPPKDVDSYIHRSGRTGRAGRTGVCICLYQRKEETSLRTVEVKAGLKFKRVGVPTTSDIIKASCKDAIRSLDSVPASVSEHFHAAAETLIEKRGALEALAAALAHISGAKSLDQRSLLNSEKGFTTMMLACSIEMHNIGFAWRGLKEQLGETVENQVKRMQFLKGKMGVCFDVPEDAVESLKGSWQDSRRWTLSVADELPELENDRREQEGNFRRHANWSQNGRGMKRSYNNAYRGW
ncbi:nucleolar RNA helicase 2 isoform X2 [Leucoraja erinacea]|uniref:nucleolar RNA helicase 2 isoform X1 n=1 Tax=Leucoraja erinaceus TaxID=7782 RepID=UPI002453E023|nr:nucleolar RNA helicase 2 isoform X1 [Leucoraja erinacea]XP_055503288.1 nucleolar RNA helicase 2 isoform X2 [Leucoraja erinacea]